MNIRLFILSCLFCVASANLQAEIISYEATDFGTLSEIEFKYIDLVDFNNEGQVLLHSVQTKNNPYNYYIGDPELGAFHVERTQNHSAPLYHILSDSGVAYGLHSRRLFSWSQSNGLNITIPFSYEGRVVSLVDCNSENVLTGTFTIENDSIPVGAPRTQLFTHTEGVAQFPPLRRQMLSLGYDCYGFTPMKINDSGQVLGKCEHGLMHPYKEAWVKKGVLYFLWDGHDTHIISLPEGSFSVKDLLCDGRVKITAANYNGFTSSPPNGYDPNPDDSTVGLFIGYWSVDAGIIWEGHEPIGRSGSAEGRNGDCWLWSYNCLNYRTAEEAAENQPGQTIFLDDLVDLSDFNKLYPGAKINRIKSINENGQIVVIATFWNEKHPFLLTPRLSD